MRKDTAIVAVNKLIDGVDRGGTGTPPPITGENVSGELP